MNNEPAFPQRSTDEDGDLYEKGLSIRDYFAAKAMHGLMDAGMPAAEIAFEAYVMADAMLEERAK